MSMTLDTIRRGLEEDELKFTQEDEVLRLRYSADHYRDTDGDPVIGVAIALSEDGERLTLYIPYAFQLGDDEPRGRILRSLMARQFENRYVRYEFDPEDGEVRMNIDLILEDNSLAVSRILSLLELLVEEAEEVYQQLQPLRDAGETGQQKDAALPEATPDSVVDAPTLTAEVTEAEPVVVPTSLDQLMPQLGFKYYEKADRFLLSFSTEHYRDRDGDRSLLLSVRDFPKARTLSVDVSWLYTVPENRRDSFAEAALAVQWRVKFLRYELDESDGEVRACIELPYSQEQFITRQQLRRALKALVGLVDEYDAFLRAVIENNQLDFSQLP